MKYIHVALIALSDLTPFLIIQVFFDRVIVSLMSLKIMSYNWAISKHNSKPTRATREPDCLDWFDPPPPDDTNMLCLNTLQLNCLDSNCAHFKYTQLLLQSKLR